MPLNLLIFPQCETLYIVTIGTNVTSASFHLHPAPSPHATGAFSRAKTSSERKSALADSPAKDKGIKRRPRPCVIKAPKMGHTKTKPGPHGCSRREGRKREDRERDVRGNRSSE